MTSARLHFELMRRLAEDPSIIPSPELWDVDDEQLLASLLESLAKPLPSGEASPFSSKSPTTAHAILSSVFIHHLGMLGYELNVKPDFDWLQHFRMLGFQQAPAQYPIIELVFRRSRDAIEINRPATIPFNTEVVSVRSPELKAYTTTSAEIDGLAEFVTVPARLNRLGEIPNLQPGEFSNMPRSLRNIVSVRNPGTTVYRGRNRQSINSMMLAARESIRQMDTLTLLPQYYQAALDAGAKKVNVVSSQFGLPDHYTDLVTVVVYPATVTATVENALRPRAAGPLQVVPAEIVGIDGIVEVDFVQNLSPQEQTSLVARAIRDNLNPPQGTWGDEKFAWSLASTLELQRGIIAVPKTYLKDAIAQTPLAEISVTYRTLFEVRNSLQILPVRS